MSKFSYTKKLRKLEKRKREKKYKNLNLKKGNFNFKAIKFLFTYI